MRKMKFGNTLMVISVLFFIVYNTYFGWNKLPVSEIEQTCDNIFSLGMVIGLVWYLLPLVKVYEDFIKSRELPNKGSSLQVDILVDNHDTYYYTAPTYECGRKYFHPHLGCEIYPIGNNCFRIKYFDFCKDGGSILGEKDPLNQTIDLFPSDIKSVIYK